MAEQREGETLMTCGNCGAKVHPNLLDEHAAYQCVGIAMAKAAKLAAQPQSRGAAMSAELVERLRKAEALGIACDACEGAADIIDGLLAERERLREALREAEDDARRYAGFYPQASDGRNTLVILADKIAANSAALAQPPASSSEKE